ncbi:MAG: IS200/IS605 family transposase [Anaerolineae bacterium]
MWICLYHAVWATKFRQPLITPEIERILFPLVISKSTTLGGQVFAVNAMPDHIHIAASIPPKIACARWVKNIKGAASFEINKLFPNLELHFQWQGGYSLHTFGAKNMQFVVGYIENQKSHHAANTIQPYLEDYGDDDMPDDE